MMIKLHIQNLVIEDVSVTDDGTGLERYPAFYRWEFIKRITEHSWDIKD